MFKETILSLLPFVLLGLIWLCGFVERQFPSKSDL
jgi:hypothetical protein